MTSKKKFILAIFLEEIKIFIKPKKGHSIWSDLFNYPLKTFKISVFT